MIDPPLVLLHLSDAHFGSKSHWGGSNPRETARVYLKEAGSALKSYGLLEDGGGFDAVVLSGDCTWGPDAHVADADHRRLADDALTRHGAEERRIPVVEDASV